MEHSQADKERGPFWRIWAAERPRRSTLKRNHMGRSVLPKRSTRRTAKETMSITAEKVTPPPPHPTQPKPHPSSVRVFASERERYYTRPPPHPTKARPQLSACVSKMNIITPPHPTQPKPDPSSVRAFASEHERYYPTPPHPTPPHQLLRVHTWDSRRGVACACAREPKNACAGEAQTGGRSLWEDGVGKRCTRL